MILTHRFVTAGLLLAILTIFIVGVYSTRLSAADEERIDEREARGLLRNPEWIDYKLKRSVRDLSGHNTGESPTKGAHGEGHPSKASMKKRKKAARAKKLMDDVIDIDKTTTHKPKEAHPPSEKGQDTTAKPHSHRSGKGSTEKPAKKDEEGEGDKSKDEKSKEEKSKDEKSKDDNSKDEDKSADVDGDAKKKRSGKSSVEKNPVAARRHKLKTEEKLKLANERWLQNQEVVAIEHMLAGVYDWMKVLKQTKGKTFNKKTAGELFDKVNNELAAMLSEQNKPSKLVSYYRQMKIK